MGNPLMPWAGVGGVAASTAKPLAPPPPRPVVNVSGGNAADVALAKALAAAGMDNSPIETPLEGIGRLAQVWSGNKMERDYNDKEANKYRSFAETLAGVTDPGKAAELAIASNIPEFVKYGLQYRMNPPKGASETAVINNKIVNMRTGEVVGDYGDPKEAKPPPVVEDYDAQGRPVKMVWNGTAYVPTGGGSKAPEPTTLERQAIAAGHAPGTPGHQKFITDNAGGAKVAVDLRAETSENSERGKTIPKHFAKIAEDLPAADGLMQSMDQLDSLLQGTETGTKPAFLEFVRKNTGLAIGEQSDRRQALESMVDYLTPRMRVPGSGASSDTDMRAFRNALPSLIGTPGGNAIISSTMRGLAERRVAMARIAEDYLVGEVDAKTASARMREMGDPFARFKAAQAGRTRADEAAGKPAKTADTPPQGVDAGVWKYMTPEERALWQK